MTAAAATGRAGGMGGLEGRTGKVGREIVRASLVPPGGAFLRGG